MLYERAPKKVQIENTSGLSTKFEVHAVSRKLKEGKKCKKCEDEANA